MLDGTQSIEDLIKASRGEIDNRDDDNIQSQFATKQAQIRLKQLETLTEHKANQLGLPYINLVNFPISPEAVSLITEEASRNLEIICFFFDGQRIRLATTNPTNESLLEQIEIIKATTFCENIEIYLISSNSLEYALKFYATLPKLKILDNGVEIKEEDLEKFKQTITDYRSLNEQINQVNMSEVIALMIAAALKIGTSDIHIEAEDRGIVIRLRVDGILQEAAVITKDKWKRVIARLKLLAHVKMNVANKPQDGRFTIFLTNDKIAVRASFLPTVYGESVVMRLLKSSSVGLPFEALGLMPQTFEILNEQIQKPNGLILVTGPTGSGKTTTLYAILNKLNQPGTKIITLEDPVEYQLEGINQSQVDESKNYTFASGLRSILRQDPDIVMVGETRDLETAEISVQAALTGHLVLSTLHTNDAAGVIPRLLDLGIKPYLLTPSLNVIVGQRLVRKLCPHCRIEKNLNDEEREKIGKILAVISPKAHIDIPSNLPTIYTGGAGCEFCNGVGYKGRMGIYEILTMTNDIKELTANGAPAFKILEQAIEGGMLTMLQDGVLKVLQGQTSLDEVYEAIGKMEYIDALYDVVMSKTIGRGLKINTEQLIKAEEVAKNLKGAEPIISNCTTTEMLSLIMASAFKSGAGDLHIDPAEAGVKIRFRVDGILQDIATLSKDHYIPIISAIKDLSGFATNLKQATYDGRFAIFLPDKSKLDCRVSIISGGYGETAVIRLLASQAAALDMGQLGIRSVALQKIQNSMTKTKGIIITTGPTGSGKTTTLYSVLNKLNDPSVKIITIEDPIEYHLDGIMQTQIDSEKGYTFAASLRSLMRQNPNIIMVGEIRDEETAETAIEAALTGHLVLSTIHANSAAGAIARLSGLGIAKNLLASSMECSIGQRLIRRICPHCKEETQVAPEIIEQVKTFLSQIQLSANITIPTEFKFYHGVGCEKCSGLGYKGRIGLYEVIDMNPQMQKLIQQELTTDSEIEQMALQQGSILMVHDGILKALEGETTIDEALRASR